MTPSNKKPSPEDWIRLVVENAAELRKAGVSSLKLGELELSLLPDAPIVKASNTDQPDNPDPLDDGFTFPNGRVPGFERLAEKRNNG